MACPLVNSIPLDCRNSVGGIAEVKFKALPSNSTLTSDYTLSSGTITIASGSQTDWFLYGMEKETASFNGKPTPNVANGTLFYEEELKIILNKMSTQKSNEIHLLGQNRLQAAIKTMNGDYWLLGYQYGLDLQPSSYGTGTARGDRNGYDLTFLGKEVQPIPNMSQATYDTL